MAPQAALAPPQRAYDGATPPINPTQLVPTEPAELLELGGDYHAANSSTERQPRTMNEAFTRVPGVNVVSDDGFARHGGIGIRGSPPRRGRKVLMDGGWPSRST